jgi:WD40 repeat protein
MECIGNVKMEMKLQTFDTGVTTFAVNDDSSLVCIVDDSSTVLLYSLTTNSNAIFVGNKLLSDKKTFVGNKLENVAKEITSKASVRAGLEFNSFNITGFKVSWLPHKELLAVAVPSTKGRIILFNRKGGKNKLSKYEDTPIWEEIHIVTSETSQLTHGTEDINLAVFSPNGRYLATADNAGIVLIWEISSQDLLNMILMSGSFVPINMLNTLPIGPLFDLVWGQKDGDNYLMLASASSSGYNCLDKFH